MTTSPITFGTSGWRGIIGDDFTFPHVRLAVEAICGHVLSQSHGKKPTVLVANDTRFFSEDFARTAAIVLAAHGIRPLVCRGFTPTPTVAYEVRRAKLDGAINFTASHNPAEYHGLKYSDGSGGPAPKEVTKDIEARAAKLAAQGRGSSPAYPSPDEAADFESIDPRDEYLKRIAELVRFDVIRGPAGQPAPKIVYDALHGCGAGYLDKALGDHGIAVQTLRANRDVLFDGTGPDVSDANLAPLSKTVKETGATIGLATDGDADRFGIVDSTGQWFSPNQILGLVYDYLIESRGWRMDVARSVATSHLVDGVAARNGLAVHETPVGFKYLGQWILKDTVALGGEESAGLSIHGHLPEKDGVLACLLVAEMTASRKATLGEQLRDLFRRVGREYWPLRANLHLPDDVKARAVQHLAADYSTFLGRRVARTDRTDGLKLVFDDGSWVLMRLSGTEPLLRVYTEAATEKESAKICDDARAWIFSGAGTAS
jgi:phosphomannomutase